MRGAQMEWPVGSSMSVQDGCAGSLCSQSLLDIANGMMNFELTDGEESADRNGESCGSSIRNHPRPAYDSSHCATAVCSDA